VSPRDPGALRDLARGALEEALLREQLDGGGRDPAHRLDPRNCSQRPIGQETIKLRGGLSGFAALSGLSSDVMSPTIAIVESLAECTPIMTRRADDGQRGHPDESAAGDGKGHRTCS
jgi:hypothetical protein